MRIKAEPLTEEGFAEFGRVVSVPAAEPSARLEGLEFWADITLFPPVDGPIGVGMARLTKHPFVQNCAERHMRTSEYLHALDGEMIVVVGPPEHPEQPRRLPDLARFRAFRVPAGDGVIMRPGVWHWAPFAVSGPTRMVVLFRAGTSGDDAAVVDFPAGSALEVEP